MRSLVISKVGLKSNHNNWAYDVKSDVLLIKQEEIKIRKAKHISVREVEEKEHSILSFTLANEYDYYLFIDENTVITASQIDELFGIAIGKKLSVFSPAINNTVFAPNKACLYRDVNNLPKEIIGCNHVHLAQVVDNEYKGEKHIIDKIDVYLNKKLLEGDCETLAHYLDKPLASVVVITTEKDKGYINGLLNSIPVWCEVILVNTDTIGEGWTLTNVNDFERGKTADMVRPKEWRFDKARNLANTLAAGHWIIQLDSDERLLTHQHDSLSEILLKNKENVGAFTCHLNMAFTVNGIKFETVRSNRIFLNTPEIYYQGFAHELVDKSLIKNKYKKLLTTLIIHHIGYEANENDIMSKLKRNIDLMCKDLESLQDEYYRNKLATHQIKYKQLMEKNNGS